MCIFLTDLYLKEWMCAMYHSTCSMNCQMKCCCAFSHTSQSGTSVASLKSASDSTRSPMTLNYGNIHIFS